MTRCKFKNKGYYKKFIEKLEKEIIQTNLWIQKGEVHPDAVYETKDSLRMKYQSLVIGKYSAGYEIHDLENDYINCVDLVAEAWPYIGQTVPAKGSRGKRFVPEFYLGIYEDILILISLGILIDIKSEYIEKLASVIDGYKAKDKLLEFLLASRIKRKLIKKESYKENFNIQKMFAIPRKVIETKDKKEAESLMFKYVTKEWYKKHNYDGYFEEYKSSKFYFQGYWTFESAAIVKIKSLDDSSFKDWKYYPYDLAHYDKEFELAKQKENKEKKSFFGKLFGK